MDLVEQYFTGTSSRIEGVGLDVLAREAMRSMHMRFGRLSEAEPELAVGGELPIPYSR